MTTWELQAQCPECGGPVLFDCSRDELTTPAGHRVLSELLITCPAGHTFEGAPAERILHGDRATPPPSSLTFTPRVPKSRAPGETSPA